MDQFDRAQEMNESYLNQALDAQLKQTCDNAALMGTTNCVDCFKKIPLARRDAHPCCVRCIFCQEKYEQGSA